MEVGIVRVAEDKDFERLRRLLDDDEDWSLDYEKLSTKVWTKSGGYDANLRMLKIATIFDDVSPEAMYDVLHDPEYRKVWDQSMIEAQDIGYLNPNNDIGYYAMACPTPLQNRDFVLQRSWLDTGQEKMILNHSVLHHDYPPRKGYVRAISYITGFLVRPSGTEGCQFGYVSQCDPQGVLPHWLVNKCTQIFAPKIVKQLWKASQNYVEWKKENNADWKPWHFPEQITAPRISMQHLGISSSNRDSLVPFKQIAM